MGILLGTGFSEDSDTVDGRIDRAFFRACNQMNRQGAKNAKIRKREERKEEKEQEEDYD